MVAVARSPDSPFPGERRASPRFRVGWKVKAITASGALVSCTVQEVSEGGARLSVPADALLPDCFHVYFPLRDVSHFVEVRWRRDLEIGVAFMDAQESELRELRLTIAHLTDRLHLLERAAASADPLSSLPQD